MPVQSGIKAVLVTAALAAPCGFLAWTFHETVGHSALSGYIWFGGLPGAAMFFALALLSFVALRPNPRTRIAIVLSALAILGASERQSYERKKIQAQCESEGITDCGSRMYGPPSVGWPAILSPFLALLYLRKSGMVSDKVTSKVIAFAAGRFKIAWVLTLAGMMAILGMLAWPGRGTVAYMEGDYCSALLAFPALFLTLVALRVVPPLFLRVILSMAAFAGVSARHTYELGKILAECHHCAGSSALPRVAEYGWPVICIPFLAFVFVKMGRRPTRQ